MLSPKRDRNQIDTILITRKGLFSIETKFWVGHIIGDDYSDIWYQKYDDPYKPDKPRKNPVKQNNVHCEIVERELNEKYIAFNYVVFASETDLTSLSSCHTYLLSDFLSHYMGLPDILCEEDIEKIYQKLYPYEATEEEMKLFKKQINARYGK